MEWPFLLLAGFLEVGWPIGLKISQTPEHRLTGIAIAVACILGSGALLWLAQKTIPMGTAYAVWTGIGATGTFLVGITFFGDSSTPLRLGSAALIVAGLIGLKIAPQG